jgi:nucleoside-diphosphate-sugar epimerase
MNMDVRSIVVAGAGGFIGGHLVKDLLRQGHQVRAVDRKPLAQWWQLFRDAENLSLDLSEKMNCFRAVRGATVVYNLAADMGGIGYIETHKAACMLSVLINTHLLMAAREQNVERYFFASSACVYPVERQEAPDVAALVESDAYPAMPLDGYGWEKLFGERMCRHFREDYGLETRVARFHNTYGPFGAWRGGREKAPAAICRKVIESKLNGDREIEIWGDGEQTRSFMYVDDCVEGMQRLLASEVAEPINVGSEELVTINQLVDLVEEFAEIKLRRRHQLDAPRGVAGRNSDNTLIRAALGWAPSTPLAEGLEATYRWIHGRMTATSSGHSIGRKEESCAQ